MKKLSIWIFLIGMISFITSSCDDTQVKPKDEEPIVVVPPVYGIKVALTLVDSTNVTIDKGGKYYLDVSNDKEWIVTFTPFDNYEVKDVLENGVSLGKIDSYLYKRNKDINLKVVFGFVPQMIELVEPFWKMYDAYDTLLVTQSIVRINISGYDFVRKFRTDGKYEARDNGKVFVYNWYFTNDEKNIIYYGGDIVKLKYIEDKILILTTIWPGDTLMTRVIKFYNMKYPKPG